MNMLKGKFMEMASVLILASAALACSNAGAMSRAPIVEVPADEDRTPPLEIERLSAGTYQQGLALGRRNGEILVNRIKLSTLGARPDCRRVDDFQDALVKVTR